MMSLSRELISFAKFRRRRFNFMRIDFDHPKKIASLIKTVTSLTSNLEKSPF